MNGSLLTKQYFFETLYIYIYIFIYLLGIVASKKLLTLPFYSFHIDVSKQTGSLETETEFDAGSKMGEQSNDSSRSKIRMDVASRLTSFLEE